MVVAGSLLSCVVLVALAGCGNDKPASSSTNKRALAVTTTMIECACRDVAGDAFQIVRMLPPGGCPGHFDISPRMIDRLRDAAILFRFDFQAGLDDQLSRLAERGLTVVEIAPGGGLLCPHSYVTMCRQVCEALCQRWPERTETYRGRLEQTERRIAALAGKGRQHVADAGLTGAKVLASEHQQAFCTWLGLDVVDTFPRGELARISEVLDSLTAAQKGHVRLVVGNLQEGTRVSDTLADRLGVPTVVFSNFPSMAENQKTFDDLFWANVGALVQSPASQPSSTRPTTTDASPTAQGAPS